MPLGPLSEKLPLVAGRPLVLDTNIVLDLLVFDDPASRGLRQALELGAVAWLATQAMRDEFERVLGYPRIAARLQSPGKTRAEALVRFARLSHPVPAAAPATVRCRDRDDQIFIDLAVAHGARLLSRDAAVLRLRKRLAGTGAMVHNGWDSA